jgi:acetate kinase
MKVLVLNSGSSGQKCSLYDIGQILPDLPPTPLWEGTIEWAVSFATSEIKSSQGFAKREQAEVLSRPQAVERLLESLWRGEGSVIASPSEIDVVGHRVVHGGAQFEDSVAITPEVKSAIASVSAFAPLHNRAELEGIELVERLLGSVLQVAVFDTSFHRTMPLAAAVYPGPYDWFSAGIRRYGFHGINHKYCARRAAQLLTLTPDSLRIVSCHLGNGCSLAAIRDGKSVDTTMGFTPLEGLMMGTRSGSVDPGILTYIMRQRGTTAQQLDDMLNKNSGLLGISGMSGDMREIQTAAKNGHERAKLALEIYVHRLQSGIGAMAGVLGGIDALVFTGGVGEHSAEVRKSACENFQFLGMKFDEQKNLGSPADRDISSPDSRVRVLIIRAQEDWEIARDCWKLMQSNI